MNDGAKLTLGITRHEGFDLLRVIAIAMIFIQHAMAVQGYYESTTQWGVNLGQAGVGIFCAISGYLAFCVSRDHPATWLKRRLLTVFPAYWIVTVFAFMLALVIGNDKATLPLFLSQMLGTGYFTHGWELVNVVSWFISLILLCYLIALIAKLSGRAVWLLLTVALLCAVLLAARQEVDLSRHILGFCLAGAFASLQHRSKRAPQLIVGASGMMVLGMFLDTQFVYGALALLLIGLAPRLNQAGHSLIVQASRHSYEFFLVHGIFLVGAAKLTDLSALAQVTAALVASIMFSPLLQVGTAKMIGFFRSPGK